MLTITKRFEFEASHYLPNHLGKCRQLHGHSYKLDVTVRGDLDDNPDSPTKGMILDFAELGEIVKPLIAHNMDDPKKSIDHGLLNNVFENPTAEVMVSYFAHKVQDELVKRYKNVRVYRVDLWETGGNYASWISEIGV